MHGGVDRTVAEHAARHHGIVSRPELTRLGMTRAGRNSRVDRGLLHPVPGCDGIFAVGHAALSPTGAVAAAVWACGPGATVAGEHAEWLWDLRPPWLPLPAHPVRVIVPRTCGRTPAAASVRRRDLPREEWTLRRGIRVATVERLLTDAGADRSAWAVERLLGRALAERRTSIPRLEAQLARAQGQHGVGTLRTLLIAERRYAGLTRSELEEAFLALLRRAGIELPATNARIGRDVIDAFFALARLVVELDGTRWHRTRDRQERDRGSELRLRGQGLLVVRYTARQILEQPELVVADLVRLLTERTR